MIALALLALLAIAGGEPHGVKCGLAIVAGDGDLPAGGLRSRLLARPATHTSILRGSFRIHFDTAGTHTPALLDAGGNRIPGSAAAYTESLAAAAARVTEVCVSALGYPAAPPDGGPGGGPEYDIYVQELDSLYGVTTPELPLGGTRSTTFMQVDNDFLFVADPVVRGLPALKVTLAHEYFHAIQLGAYGYAGGAHLAFYEMSSVWMEEAVFDEVNDYYAYLVSSRGHFRRPEVPFLSTDLIMYSRGIWCIYLAERFGPAVIREIWELVSSTTPINAMQQVLARAPYAVGFRSAFADWALWNYRTAHRAGQTPGYDEAAAYPAVQLRTVEYTPPRRAVADALAPLSARYHRVLLTLDSLTLIAVNVDLEGAMAGVSSAADYRILLDDVRQDDSYREPVPGLFTKLEAAVPASWYVWDVLAAGVVPAAFEAGAPFPLPLRPGPGRTVFIPLASPVPLTGRVSIFSAGMTRVADLEQTSAFMFGRQVFSWDGRGEDGEPVATGVYIYVLDTPEGVRTGKIAVVRP
jgi:hypothetical protein